MDRNAKFRWYRYDSKFALPVYDEKGEATAANAMLEEKYRLSRSTIMDMELQELLHEILENGIEEHGFYE